jgi:hypothetical protein
MAYDRRSVTEALQPIAHARNGRVNAWHTVAHAWGRVTEAGNAIAHAWTGYVKAWKTVAHVWGSITEA